MKGVIPLSLSAYDLLEVHQLAALLRRTSPSHMKKELIHLDYRKIRRAFRGEKEVEYPLRFLDKQKYVCLHRVKLRDDHGYFEIDKLVLSERFMLILEVKNWYGTIEFGENGQVTRYGDNDIVEGFPNSVPQAKLQRHRLQKWLASHSITAPPINFFVVISSPSTIIKPARPGLIPDKVLHNSELFFEIQRLESEYTEPVVKMKNVRALFEFISANIIKEIKTPLEKYQITYDELIKGVFCPNCKDALMIRKRQAWYCSRCQNSSRLAHEKALLDYKLLVGNWIRNQDLRGFLNINNENISKYILKNAMLDHRGTTSDRVYDLSKLSLPTKLDVL